MQLDAKELELSDLKEQVQKAQQGVEAQLSQVCAAGRLQQDKWVQQCVRQVVHKGVGMRGWA